MKLIQAHKLLIGASIGLGVIFALWSGAMYMKKSELLYAIGSVASFGAAGALYVYLQRFIVKNQTE